MIRRYLIVFIAFFALFAAAASANDAGIAISGKGLLEELRKGGYIVYFRHTQTLPEHAHEAKMRRDGKWHVEYCDTQRNLSEAGYVQARHQRDMIAKLGIPYGKAYASQACRTRIHAQWVVPNVAFSDALTPLRSREKGLLVRKMLNTPPAPGTNTFIFAHGGILWNATDYASEESETFIFRPVVGDKPPELIATIKIGEWDLMARGNLCCAPRAYWRGQGEPPVD